MTRWPFYGWASSTLSDWTGLAPPAGGGRREQVVLMNARIIAALPALKKPIKRLSFLRLDRERALVNSLVDVLCNISLGNLDKLCRWYRVHLDTHPTKVLASRISRLCRPGR
jgi:hypothetical protein